MPSGRMGADLKRLRRDWDELGRRDPLWAVLTAPDKRGRRWDEAEFFNTGAEVVAGIIGYVESLGLALRRAKALDFGCGVGRLTQPLAEHFDQVWGVDIAPSMIELARSYNRHGERCTYRLNEREDLSLFEDESFDFILSLITLQHMEPAYAKAYLREFVRTLARGGVMVFQTAAEPIAARRSRAGRFFRRLTPEPVLRAYRMLRDGHLIDMYGIPRHEVVGVVEEKGGRVVDVVADSSAGGRWTSFRYCVCRD